MMSVKHEGEGLPDCRFVKANSRSVVVDGKTRPWFVVVPRVIGAAEGDMVKVSKQDGSTVWVRLVTPYPYSDPKTARELDRWTFMSVNEDGTPDRIARENSEMDAAAAARTDIDPSDGRPTWWSRKQDGSVLWPQDGQVWRDRQTSELGVVLRDKANAYQICWYTLVEDVDPDQLEALFPEGLPRRLYGKSRWMTPVVFMETLEFVWKPTSRQERVRAWARAHGYEVKDRGGLSKAVMAAYELSEES